ncbi:FAD-binding oxidoreductase [Pseudomonas sp. RIT-PI-AD]|uniref:NAD(P)/FAD-dependent oxidoreductase n=1 Tax=Pseudomonas sp. RIT-PI-AD TaxID=3035294 RepID=UPI0021D973D8|nr:FAD-binding oxidoreductase [Pseudomonas sp. RIT-PI-AD]
MPQGCYPLYPALASAEPLPAEVDVVIAGAGIMGCATAYHLRQRGLSVLVCDKAGLASQQSTRAWGFVRQQARDPAEVPLMQAAIPLWQGLETELQAPLEWRQGGCLYLAETDQQMADYHAWLQVAAAHGLDTRLLDAREVAALWPALARPAKGGLFTASDGQAEPRRVAPAYAYRARELGARFAEGCGVQGIDRANGAICGVQTERGYVKTRRLLIAAGASSWRLLALLGLDIPQQGIRCTVSRTSPGPAIGAGCFIGHGIGIRQRADGSFNLADEAQADIDLSLGYLRGASWYLPLLREHHRSFRFRLNGAWLHDLRQRLSGDHPALGERDPHVRPEDSRVRAAERALTTAFPALREVRVVESWAGLIDVLPDGIPVLDAAARVPGLLVATGFCGHGFALGPLVGREMARWLDQGQPGLDLSAFRLGRFADGSAGKPYSLF